MDTALGPNAARLIALLMACLAFSGCPASHQCWRLATAPTQPQNNSLVVGQTHVCVAEEEVVAFIGPQAWERWTCASNVHKDDTRRCETDRQNRYHITMVRDGDRLVVHQSKDGEPDSRVGTFAQPPVPGVEQQVADLPATEAFCARAASCIAAANQRLRNPVDLDEEVVEQLESVTQCRNLKEIAVARLEDHEARLPSDCR